MTFHPCIVFNLANDHYSRKRKTMAKEEIKRKQKQKQKLDVHHIYIKMVVDSTTCSAHHVTLTH